MQDPQIRKVRRFCADFVPRSDIIQDKKTRLGYIKQKMIICTLGRNKLLMKYYLCQGHFVLFDPTYRNIIGGYSPVVMYL